MSRRFSIMLLGVIFLSSFATGQVAVESQQGRITSQILRAATASQWQNSYNGIGKLRMALELS